MPEPGSPGTNRLFIALTVPEEVKARIVEAQHRLRLALPAETVRWARPEQFHLTLRFLGKVDSSRTDTLVEALRTAAQGFGSLRLRAAGIGFFPQRGSPRVVWVGVTEEHDRLAVLAAAVGSVTNSFTSEDQETHFTGHITLARIKSIRPREAEALAAAAHESERAVLGEWTSTEVEIIRSELSPQGARYTSMAAIPLPAAAP